MARRWLLLSALLCSVALSAQSPVPVTFAWDVDPYAASAEIERDGVTQPCPFLELRPTEHRCTVSWPVGTATFRARMANATGAWGPWSEPLVGTVPQPGSSAPGAATIIWHSPIELSEPEPPSMADYLTHLAPQSVTFSAAGQTHTFAFDFGTAPNRAALVFVGWRDRGNTMSATIDSVSTPSLGSIVTTGNSRTQIFGLAGPASGTVNLAVTASVGSNSSPAQVSVLVFEGVDQVTPFDYMTPTTGSGSTANIVSSITVNSATGDRAAFFHYTTNGSASVTATPTGYTERADAANGGGFSTEFGDAAGATTVQGDATWSNTAFSIQWAAFGVNVNAAAAAGGSLPPPPFNYAPFLVR